jgi:glutaconate CoA-transferase subunit B
MNQLAPTAKELTAVFISRQIENDYFVSLGANLPVCTAGIFLAHLTKAPDLRIHAMGLLLNLAQVDRIEELNQVSAPRLAKYAEATMSLEESFYFLARMHINFFGAMQIDQYGNSNLIGIGADPRRLKVRGPGCVGTSTIGSTVVSFYYYVGNHSPRVFVDRCDFRSTVGWNEGGAEARQKLGLPGGGPTYVLTPKCIMDFEEESKRMRLRYLLPGVTLEDVVANTGFELVIPARVEVLPEPTEEEMTVLRTRVDPYGLLRK